MLSPAKAGATTEHGFLTQKQLEERTRFVLRLPVDVGGTPVAYAADPPPLYVLPVDIESGAELDFPAVFVKQTVDVVSDLHEAHKASLVGVSKKVALLRVLTSLIRLDITSWSVQLQEKQGARYYTAASRKSQKRPASSTTPAHVKRPCSGTAHDGGLPHGGTLSVLTAAVVNKGAPTQSKCPLRKVVPDCGGLCKIRVLNGKIRILDFLGIPRERP